MSEFEKVADVAELPVGSVKAYVVAGRKLAVCHTVRGFFATDDACPHRGGPLSEGDILGDEIVCPWHLWSFRLDTGVNPCSLPGNEIRVRTHEVRIEGDAILVRLTREEHP
ncbi:MAG: Rieske 2Fe-2S domain-containing protein [Acidobacteria bacterium]|nr:Rieske 2Fe-2S domain-containing protein [Acidobacteriota bacterium]